MPTQLAEREVLPSANALTEFSTQLGALIGPLLGAWLVAIANPSTAFAFDGITFLASATSLLAIRLPTGFAVKPKDRRTRHTLYGKFQRPGL